MCICMCVSASMYVCMRVLEVFEWEWWQQYSSKKQLTNKTNERVCTNRITRSIHFLFSLSLCVSISFYSLRLLPPHLFFERFVARWSSSFNSFVKAITLDFVFVVVYRRIREANEQDTARTHTHSSKLGTFSMFAHFAINIEWNWVVFFSVVCLHCCRIEEEQKKNKKIIDSRSVS